MNANYTVVEKTGSTDVILDLYNEFVAQQCMLQFVKSGRVAVPRDSIENLTELLFNEDYKRKPTKDNKYPGHCGIYIGDRKFIHATILKGSVVVNDLEDIIDYSKLKPKKWVRKLVGFKRYIN